MVDSYRASRQLERLFLYCRSRRLAEPKQQGQLVATVIYDLRDGSSRVEQEPSTSPLKVKD